MTYGMTFNVVSHIESFSSVTFRIATIVEKGNDNSHKFSTGPPNEPVLFCSLASVVVCRLSSFVTLPSGGRPAAGRVGGRAADTPWQASSVTSR